MGKFIDLTGKRFGKLTVIKRTDDYISPKGKHSVRWLCQCEYGTVKAIAQSSLKSGDTQSCGCSQHDKITTRGLYGTRLYHIWGNMKRRCNSKSDSSYEKN